MMITIHGLPPRTTFQAVKALVKQECNIIDFILDNLVDDGPNSKKVRIGVSDDTEGYRLMKCLDGFRMSPSHLLKIVPVGKSLNVPPQQNYDQRSGFSNQPRNDYPNQSRQDYQNQPMNDYANRGGPHGPRGSTDSRHPGPGGQGNQDSRHYGGPDQRHMDHGVPDSRGPLRTPEIRHHGPSDNRHQASQGSLDNRNPQGSQDPIRGQPWGPNVNSPNNQWGPQGPGGQVQSQNSYNQRPEAGFGSQHSQGSDHYAQGRGPPDQGYGFPSKTNVPERVAPARETRQHVLRSVEIVDSARPYQQEKPVIIMKDNFQGPSQYNTSGQQPQRGHFSAQERGPISAWAQPGQQNKPNLPYNDRRHPAVDKRPDMPEQMTQGYDKRDPFSPPRNRLVSPSRNIKPSNVSRNYQEPAGAFPVGDRRISPTRRLGPPVREFSPSGRRISPTGRRVSPPGRRISPNGRRVSPPGRRVSPPGRRVSPPGRRVSPTGRRLSPPGRRVSPPGRGGSPSDRRISPPGRKMSPGRRMSPGRNEPRRMSPNERRAGRRDSPRRFSPKRASPGATRRLASPPLRTSRFSPNLLGDKTVDKFMDDGKVLKPVRPAYEPAQAQNQTYTGGYRDSAPYGGRPEPWAEKIMYPSKKDDERRDMARRPDIGMEKSPSRLSRSPRRERSPLKERYRRHSPSPRSSRSPRRSWALEKRSSPEPIREPPPPPIWPGQDPDKRKRFEESKRDPVWEMPDRRSEEPRPFESKLRVRTDLENKFAAARPSPRDDDDRPKFSRESPRRDEKKPFSDIDKDFQDIYKRAVEFRKKTEERKSGERRRDDYEDRYRPTAREDSPRRDRKDQKVEWNTQDRKRILLTPAIKSKRDKAVEEISNRIIDKYKISGDQRYRVMEELKVTLHNIFMEMFSNKDVSFIELVIKYQARYDAKEEEKLMHDVLSRLPSQYRNLKRKTDGDTSEVPSKTSRRSPQRNAREERNYVPSDRKHFTSRQYDADRRHGIGFKHSSRPTKRRAPERVITREAVLYGKTDALEDRPVKKTPQARPKTEPARTEPAPKIKAVEEKLAPASLEPTADGHYELSPLMSKLLEVELDDVMNKVAKATPNVMCSEAERIVVETFKNKAGEAMRNTIGLNVTKRLLNVHNPLYVKMVFSAKPARADLVSFLKKYNVSAFKRAGTHGGIFAAKMRNFQDFDQLCTSNDLSCGTVRVTVTPCYQFMTCPPNLRTRYTIKEVNKNSPKKNYDANIETANLTESQEVKPVQKETILQTDANKQSVTHKVTPTKPNQSETAKITDKPTPIAEKQNTATKVTPSKPAATSDQNASPKVTPAKPTVTNDQNTTDKAVPAKPAAANNSTTKVTPAAANNQKATPKVTPAAAKNQNDTPKVTPQTANNENATSKVTPAKPSAENTPKVTPAKPSAENTPKITPAKPSAENTPKVTPAKPSAENTPKITPAKPSAENTPKITPAKPSAENTPKVTPATQTATLSKPAPNSKTATKPQPAKPVAVKTPAKPKPYQASNKAKVTPVKPTAGKKKHENDYDELDDHDILALISEGIVLDECSGSEDEV